jgi:hypothetical protein
MEGKAKREQSTGIHFGGGGGSGGRLWHAYENAARQRQRAQFRHVSKGQSGIEGTSAIDSRDIQHTAAWWPRRCRERARCTQRQLAHQAIAQGWRSSSGHSRLPLWWGRLALHDRFPLFAPR